MYLMVLLLGILTANYKLFFTLVSTTSSQKHVGYQYMSLSSSWELKTTVDFFYFPFLSFSNKSGKWGEDGGGGCVLL